MVIEQTNEELGLLYCQIDYRVFGSDDPEDALKFAREITRTAKIASLINSWGLETASGNISAKRQEVLRVEYRMEFRGC